MDTRKGVSSGWVLYYRTEAMGCSYAADTNTTSVLKPTTCPMSQVLLSIWFLHSARENKNTRTWLYTSCTLSTVQPLAHPTLFSSLIPAFCLSTYKKDMDRANSWTPREDVLCTFSQHRFFSAPSFILYPSSFIGPCSGSIALASV